MTKRKQVTFVLMDAPYENGRTTTALRLIDAAVRRGLDVNVFAYEGAIGIPSAGQAPHANAVHGRDAAEEDHPNPKQWVAALIAAAEQGGSRLDWVQCGLCVDERGISEWIAGPRRGTPADLATFSAESDNTLVIPTK